jgi:hypothetical protein
MSRNKAENLAEYSKVRVPVQRCTEFGNVVLKLLKTYVWFFLVYSWFW